MPLVSRFREALVPFSGNGFACIAHKSLIVDGFRRVRRSTFTEGAIMERAQYKP